MDLKEPQGGKDTQSPEQRRQALIAKDLAEYPMPEDTLLALDNFRREGGGANLGGFLQACIAGLFQEAACTADSANALALASIGRYIAHKFPGSAYGSMAKVHDWRGLNAQRK